MKKLIYTLSDPRTGLVRYVGATINTRIRLLNHCKDIRQTRNRVWIKGLQEQGLKPEMVVIDEAFTDWEFWEQYWIAQFKSWGFNLNNMTTGGDKGYERKIASSGKRMGGSKKGRKLCEETKRKMSSALIGNKNRLGIKHTQEVKDKMSRNRRGKYRGSYHIAMKNI